MNNPGWVHRISTLLDEKKIKQKDVYIQGDTIRENELNSFISSWDFSGMPFAIIETLKEMNFTKDLFAKEYIFKPEDVERTRIFGEAGDLDIRRHETVFVWRYIGRVSPPAGQQGMNFWNKNSDTDFFIGEKQALLWGIYHERKGAWHDDRVAKALLSYPVEEKRGRVKLHYKTLSQKGCIQFVWYTGIEGGDYNHG